MKINYNRTANTGNFASSDPSKNFATTQVIALCGWLGQYHKISCSPTEAFAMREGADLDPVTKLPPANSDADTVTEDWKTLESQDGIGTSKLNADGSLDAVHMYFQMPFGPKTGAVLCTDFVRLLNQANASADPKSALIALYSNFAPEGPNMDNVIRDLVGNIPAFLDAERAAIQASAAVLKAELPEFKF